MKAHLFIVCIGLLCLMLAASYIDQNAARDIEVISSSSHAIIRSVVILDAGHGGEDGGAVAPDGTPEKDLNLRFTGRISAFFALFGIPYREIRTADVSVGDPTLGSVRERKRSDILSRYALVNQDENAVLISIHQNLFTEAQYSGTQVFYAKHIPESETIANSIQNSVVKRLQPDNHREIKASGSNIYLLYNAKRPSVLVECGFLSNPEELALLKSPVYETALSYAIVRGLIDYFSSTQINADSETQYD